MPALTRKLGLLEAVGVSLSMIGPTLGVAFNTSLVAGAAGPATPLAFAIGTVVIILVGLSFVSFSRDLAHAGSAYAYVRAAFGRRWGFMAGWVMFLGYLAFIGATCALVGNFVDAAVEDCGLHLPHQGLVGSAAALVLAPQHHHPLQRLHGLSSHRQHELLPPADAPGRRRGADRGAGRVGQALPPVPLDAAGRSAQRAAVGRDLW